MAGSQEKAQRWWDRFGDERLSRVVGQVLESNNDPAAAALTLKQARIRWAHGPISAPTRASTAPAVTQNRSTAAVRRRATAPPLSLSYELDLWGKLARIREQSEWR
ncbi:MAG: hypothetical protein ACLR17_13625 [Enterobacteriaceae bacterium]